MLVGLAVPIELQHFLPSFMMPLSASRRGLHGRVVRVEKTRTSCFGGDGDSPYTCMVFVKVECQTHTR